MLLLDHAPVEERFNALGDTVNTAARLQSEAGTGGVAVGPVTARQVEAAFELEAVGPIVLKGKADRVPVYLASVQREARRLLVGRDAELAVDELFEELATVAARSPPSPVSRASPRSAATEKGRVRSSSARRASPGRRTSQTTCCAGCLIARVLGRRRRRPRGALVRPGRAVGSARRRAGRARRSAHPFLASLLEAETEERREERIGGRRLPVRAAASGPSARAGRGPRAQRRRRRASRAGGRARARRDAWSSTRCATDEESDVGSRPRARLVDEAGLADPGSPVIATIVPRPSSRRANASTSRRSSSPRPTSGLTRAASASGSPDTKRGDGLRCPSSRVRRVARARTVPTARARSPDRPQHRPRRPRTGGARRR